VLLFVIVVFGSNLMYLPLEYWLANCARCLE